MRNWLRDRFGRRKEQKDTGTLPDPGLMKNEKSQSTAGESGPAESSLLPGETRRDAPREPEVVSQPPATKGRRSSAPEPVVEATGSDDAEEGSDAESDSNSDGSAQAGADSGDARTGRARRRRRGRGGKGRRGDKPVAAEAAAPAKAEKPFQPTMDHLSGIPSQQEDAAPAPAPGRVRNRRERGEGRREPREPREPRPAPVPVEASESEDPIAAAPAVARKSKGSVVLSIGLPGSGKSSWFKRNSITPLSSDQIRFLLFDDETDQKLPDLVFSNLRSMLRARLVAKRPMSYVDATNLTPHDRQTWIKMANDYGYEAHAVYFDVPLEVCLQRNQTRKRQVEDDVLRKMAAKIKAPTFEEGFTKITVVRVKRKADENSGDDNSANAEAAETTDA